MTEEAVNPARLNRRGLALLSGGAALVVVLLVLRRAWVSDDALITFRYVVNTLEGWGPVYNLGERVQGYTHPLWFLALVAGTTLYPDPYFVAIAFGIGLSAVTAVVLSSGIARLAGREKGLSVRLVAVGVLILVSSNNWLEFQTGGLENALVHVLGVWWALELLTHGVDRPGRIVGLSALICLARPDLLFLVAPAGALTAWRARGSAAWLRIGIAAIPGLAWIAFAWLFYGSAMPNSASAKLGIFPTRVDSAVQGLRYVVDWLVFEPVPGLATVLGIIVIFRKPGSPAAKTLALGLMLQLLWVVWIGGDFMRGRFLLPVFTVAVVGGLFTVAAGGGAIELSRRRGVAVLGVALIAVLTMQVLAQLHRPGVNSIGVTDEWSQYPGHRLWSVLRTGELQARTPTDLPVVLRQYADWCGPFAIRSDKPGYLGYVAGSEVTVIDILGLTDATIAHLPRANLVDSRPRPGHPFKAIPYEYLWSRGDVRLQEGWEEAIRAGDCDLRESAGKGESPTGLFVPETPARSR